MTRPTPSPNFEILATLGEGGMGVVYRVRDRRLGRAAALKVLSETVAEPEQELRFFREAQVLARLNHPNIPPLYEAGRGPGGQAFMLMRLVEGATLEERLAAGEQRRTLLEALVDVGEAVAYAHSEGVLHRDLKPANIMIGRFGEVLVLDWGLAGVDAESPGTSEVLEGMVASGLTLQGSVMGTPGYMAPEQARGEALDPRADVFALGAILTKILTGEPPVSARDGLGRLSQTIKGEIRRPRAIRADVPAELDALAAAALEPDPARRLSSAQGFVADLRAYLSGSELAAYPYSLVERWGRWQRRRAGLLFALSLALLFAAGLWAQSARSRRAELALAETRSARAARRLLKKARGDAMVGRGLAEIAPLLEQAGALGLSPAERIEAAAICVAVKAPNRARVWVERALREGERDPELLMRVGDVLDRLGDEAAARAIFEETARREGFANRASLRQHFLRLRWTGRAGVLDSEFIKAILERERLLGEADEATKLARFMSEAAGGSYKKPGQVPEELVGPEAPGELFSLGELLRGYAFALAGDREASLLCLKRATIEGLPWATALFIKGLCEQRFLQRWRAKAALEQAVEADASFMAAHRELGEALLTLDKPAQARAAFEKAQALRDTPRGRLGLGRAALAELRLDEAEAAFAALLEEEPELGEAREALGMVAEQRSQFARALDLFEQAAASHAMPSRCHFRRARILRALKQREEALAELDRAIARGPELIEVHRFRAQILFELERLEEAVAAYSVALASKVNRPEVLADRGAVLHRLGRKQEALEDYSRALKIKPDQLRTLVNRGFLLADMNRPREAERDLAKFLSLAPRHRESGRARRLLAQLRGER